MIYPTLLALTLFANQYDCMHQMDMDIASKHKDATFHYIGKTSASMSLYGATAIFKCEGVSMSLYGTTPTIKLKENKYTIHLMTGIRLSDFPL